MNRCEYSNGCPIEPLVEQQESLTQERDRLYFSVRGTNDLNLIEGLMAKAKVVQALIDQAEKRKNYLHPCKHCLFQ